MSRVRCSAIAIAVLAVVGSAGGPAVSQLGPPAAQAAEKERFQVLVYSRTAGFRHFSIEAGVEALREIGRDNGFRVVATEDRDVIKSRNLQAFEAVVFLNTTGNVLQRDQQSELRRYMRRGGGFVGIHSAADTEHGWPFYDRLVGALFRSHPLQQPGSLDNEAPDHPATAHLEPRFTVFEEFYSFKRNPREDVRVLLTIDESSYLADPNTSDLPGNDPPVTGYMGDHPMSWCHRNVGGRVFYTALGHAPYLYSAGWFRRHLLGGILTAAGKARADCRARAG